MSTHQTSFTVIDGIERGQQYRFRYRVQNVNGWSAFSDVAYIFAFEVPERPPKPVFTSADDTSVTLAFEQSSDNNGIPIADYELFIDAGDDTTSAFTKLDSYSGFLASHTLTVAADGLGDPSTVYRVKLRAVNEDD